MSVLALSLSRARSTLLDVRRCGPIGRGKRLKIVVVRVRIPLPVLARPCRCSLLISVPFNGRVLIIRGVLLLSVLSGTPRFGYVAEWFKARVSKTCEPHGFRRFESYSFRLCWSGVMLHAVVFEWS